MTPDQIQRSREYAEYIRNLRGDQVLGKIPVLLEDGSVKWVGAPPDERDVTPTTPPRDSRIFRLAESYEKRKEQGIRDRILTSQNPFSRDAWLDTFADSAITKVVPPKPCFIQWWANDDNKEDDDKIVIKVSKHKPIKFNFNN